MLGFFDRRVYRYMFVGLVLVILILLILLIRCSRVSLQLYENLLLGLTFEYPRNWDVKTDERLNNLIVLVPRNRLFNEDSVRMELYVVAVDGMSLEINDSLQNAVDTIGSLYGLEGFTVIETPAIVDHPEYEIVMTTISILTMSIPDDSPRNQMGGKYPNKAQLVDIYVIRNEDNRFMSVYIYRGLSDELNAQAEEILHSIQFVPLQ